MMRDDYADEMSDETTELTETEQRIKQQFEAERGYWSELWEGVLRLDSEFFDRYRELSAHPWEEGVLDPKIKEFIYIAMDVSTTHLYNPGARIHIRNALEHGATVDELLEVIQLSSVLGIHSIADGVPLLVEHAGRPENPEGELTDDQKRVKAEFEAERGYWSELWDDILALDHEYLEKYLHYSAHPWNEGVLDPKVKEFIYIAIDISTTHLYHKGVDIHIENALDHGATREEILEVFQLVSVIGIHSVTEAVPILIEEAKRYQQLPDEY